MTLITVNSTSDSNTPPGMSWPTKKKKKSGRTPLTGCEGRNNANQAHAGTVQCCPLHLEGPEVRMAQPGWTVQVGVQKKGEEPSPIANLRKDTGQQDKGQSPSNSTISLEQVRTHTGLSFPIRTRGKEALDDIVTTRYSYRG